MKNRDFWLVLAASFFYMASPMLVTPLIVGFSGALGASGAVMGIIGGLMNLCSLVCRPLVGNLADRMSKYRLSCFGAALMFAACLGYAAAPGPAVLVAARVVNGVGYACCSVCMSAWISDMLPREKIGSGMGLYGTMNALSMAVAPAIGVWVYQRFENRVAFGLAAAFAAAIVGILRLVRNKGEAPVRPARADGRRTFHLIERNVLPFALIIMLFAIPYCATQSFLVSYVAAGHIAATVGLFFPLYAAVLLLLRLSLKSLFDKLPFAVFLLASSLSAAASMLALTGMRGNLGLAAAAICMAGGYGIMCSVCQSAAILSAGEGRRGLANSTYYIGLDSGMALGPMAGGFLYGNFDIRAFYPALELTVPLGLLVYFTHWLWKRRKMRRA